MIQISNLFLNDFPKAICLASLALMDYALRRRFAFFDFAPAFSSEGFKNYLSEKDSPKLEKLIAAVESLNSTISTDESLGDGFRIGHSYFCTDDEITDEWLKSVVEYEVIPLIKEYNGCSRQKRNQQRKKKATSQIAHLFFRS